MNIHFQAVALAAALLVGVSTAQTINEDLKLTASDRAGSDWFGAHIAIDNGIVAVGALGNDDIGSESGSAYLFNTSTGTQIFKLLPNDGAEGDQFGSSIAIDNGIVAIGADSDDDNLASSGSVYLFDASTGAQLLKLLPSDGDAGNRFGNSIAIANGLVAVGAVSDDVNGNASGSAYLFDALTGTQLFKLLPDDGAEGDLFGYSIAIDNGIVAVGSLNDDDSGHDSGSVYLFDALTSAQIFKLLPDDGADNDDFGWSVAIDNGVVVVGARRDDFNGTESGSVYLFDSTTGLQLAHLLPIDGAAFDEFGSSVDIADGVIAVGAHRDEDNGQAAGSAYIFDASTFVQISKLLPSDGGAFDEFGVSIGIDNGVVAVGASLDDGNGSNCGSAYVFDTVVVPCPADMTGDGELNFFDVSVFLTFFQFNDPIADFNGDGELNFFDVSAFLSAFAAGCP